MYSNLIYMCNTAHVFSNKNHLLQKKNSSLKKWLFAVDYVKNFTIIFCTYMASHEIWGDEIAKAICKPRHCNLGIETRNGTAIGTDMTNAIFSSTIRSIDHKLSRVVTYDEWTLHTKSRDTSIKFSRDKSKLYYLQFHIMQNLQT